MWPDAKVCSSLEEQPPVDRISTQPLLFDYHAAGAVDHRSSVGLAPYRTNILIAPCGRIASSSTLMSDIHSWITTSNGFEGFRVVRYLGIVRGITVRSRSVFGQVGAAFQSLGGGNITLYTELAETSRREAYEIMIQHAAALGANAVLAMRYDATEVAQGMTEVIAYGTAVVIEAAPHA